MHCVNCLVLGPPDVPTDFTSLVSSANSVVLTWTKGSDGGHPQTFVILYKEVTANVYRKKELNDASINRLTICEIKNLKANTNYEFLLYSFNEKGNSSSHVSLKKRTSISSKKGKFNVVFFACCHFRVIPSSKNKRLFYGLLFYEIILIFF